MHQLLPLRRRSSSSPTTEAAATAAADTIATATADTAGIITGARGRSSTPPSLPPAGGSFPGAFLPSVTALPLRSCPRRFSGTTMASTDNASTTPSVAGAAFGLCRALLVVISLSATITPRCTASVGVSISTRCFFRPC